MKMIKVLVASVFAVSSTFNSNATILTVDNNVDAPAGVYTEVQLAADAANPGDSLYIVGSTVSYGVLNVKKELHIFGAGYKPNKQNAISTKLNVHLWLSVIDIPSGSSVSGVEGYIDVSNGLAGSILENISISRCQGSVSFNGGNLIKNCTITNNRITTLPVNGATPLTNVLISNNLISYPSVMCGVGSTVVIKNNLFFEGSTSFGNTIVTNNIFYGSSHSTVSSNVTYNNNITFGSVDNNLVLTGTNNGGGNFIGVNPSFVNVPAVNYNDTYNYNLLLTSPGIAAGTDGTDIGIYGGAYAWPEGGATSGDGYMYAQEADIPQVNQMNVQNASVPLNGTLNVTVTGITNH